MHREICLIAGILVLIVPSSQAASHAGHPKHQTTGSQIARTALPGRDDWLEVWLSGPLPGQSTASANAVRKAAPQSPGQPSAKFGGGNWLEAWLSGPLPGRLPKAKANKGGAPASTISWPASSVPRRAPFRKQIVTDHVRAPSMRGKPRDNHIRAPGLSLGAGLVFTSGMTTWNHDATSASASLGNPSSELTYDDVSAVALEFDGRADLKRNWFVRGNLGIGVELEGDGNFRDDDFQAGQVLFSSTDSVIPDANLFYVTADIGKQVVRLGNDEIAVSLFTGIQYWREEYHAYGLFNRLTSQTAQSDDTAVLSNLVEWTSLRLGVLGYYKPTDRLSWNFDLAFIPIAGMHNEDSHWLRTASSALGPAPNVIMDGTGFGFEGLIGMEYLITPRLAWSMDLRYWHLTSDGEITTGVNTSSPSTFPLNDLATTRYGVKVGLKYAL